MKIEDQVCSLELAKRLKELGIKQKSFISWVHQLNNNYELFVLQKPWDECISAFTVAELGKMLPWDIVIARNIDKYWHIFYQANGKRQEQCYDIMGEANEANARAKMLIYLIENGLHKP